MKTQAISGIDFDKLLEADRARRALEAADAEVESADSADPTEAIDFSDFMASGAMEGGADSSAEPELNDNDPTQAMNFESFEAALKAKEEAEAEPETSPFGASANKLPEPEVAPIVPPRPSTPPQPSAPAQPSAPPPPKAAAPDLGGPPGPLSGGSSGGGDGSQGKSKKGLFIGLGVVALLLFCCCPASVGGYLYSSQIAALVSGTGEADLDEAEGDEADGGEAEGAEADGGEAEGDEAEGDEAEGDEAEGDEAEGDEAEGDEADGSELEGDAVKKAIESAGFEVVTGPTASEVGGVKVVTFAVKKDAASGAVVVSSYGDVEMAKQTVAAHEMSDQTTARRKGDVVVAVSLPADKEAAASLLDAIIKE